LILGEALVNSKPDGAQVRFDGNSDPVFVTPAMVGAIPPGRHSVVFSKPGFESQTVTLEVVAGARSAVAAQLVRKGPVFKISSDPAGAAILLDGNSTDLTSPAELRVEASGTHTIKVVRSGFLPEQSQVSIRDGENVSVAFPWCRRGTPPTARCSPAFACFPEESRKRWPKCDLKPIPRGRD
jgi:hypothetical protein